MVLESKQTTIAYRCPSCGTGVMSAVSLFALKGSMVRLKCECGKSAMEICPAISVHAAELERPLDTFVKAGMAIPRKSPIKPITTINSTKVK